MLLLWLLLLDAINVDVIVIAADVDLIVAIVVSAAGSSSLNQWCSPTHNTTAAVNTKS